MTLATRMLSPHFSEVEFVSTRHMDLWQTNWESWADNLTAQANAQRFLNAVVEQVRLMVGRLITTSGYRCPEVNAAVGSRTACSRHVLGLAIDVIPMDCSIGAAMSTISRALDAGALQDLDKAILEGGWIHLQGSPNGTPPRRALLATSDGVHFEPYARSQA